jgi:hypothetical protein
VANSECGASNIGKIVSRHRRRRSVGRRGRDAIVHTDISLPTLLGAALALGLALVALRFAATKARARTVARWRQVRVLRVAIQELSQHLDLLGQRRDLRIALGYGGLERGDAPISFRHLVSFVANRHGQLGSHSDPSVHPSRSRKCRGLNGYDLRPTRSRHRFEARWFQIAWIRLWAREATT